MSTPGLKHVFLSHRSVDKEFVRRLKGDLEKSIDGSGGFSCWLDEAEIKPGQSITGLVNRGLETSRFFALIMSPAYFASESGWTDAEWHAVLFTDPDNRRSRIIPIYAQDCPYVPMLLRHLSAIDMRGRAYKDGLARLREHLNGGRPQVPSTYRGQVITAALRIDRSTLVSERAIIDSMPDRVAEVLQANLLPVLSPPREVFSAPLRRKLAESRPDGTLRFPGKQELRQVMDSAQRDAGVEQPIHPAYRIISDRVVTFHDLEEPDTPLALITEDDEIDVIPTQELLNDPDEGRVVMSLLNMALERHAYRVGLVPDRSRFGRYIFPPDNGKERKVPWRPYKRSTVRTVAKPIRSEGQTTLWIHQGAYLKFLNLGGKLFLQIIPTWVLSEGGQLVKGGPQVGSLVSRWTSAERNLQVFYHVRFWAAVLRRSSPGPINIRAGDQGLEIRTRPALINLKVGIRGDHANLEQQLDVEAELLTKEEERQLEDLAANAEELEALIAEDESDASDEEPSDQSGEGDAASIT